VVAVWNGNYSKLIQYCALLFTPATEAYQAMQRALDSSEGEASKSGQVEEAQAGPSRLCTIRQDLGDVHVEEGIRICKLVVPRLRFHVDSYSTLTFIPFRWLDKHKGLYEALQTALGLARGTTLSSTNIIPYQGDSGQGGGKLGAGEEASLRPLHVCQIRASHAEGSSGMSSLQVSKWK